jgi:hypothetical protein
MSRSGYYYDCDDPLVMGRWRAAVRSAMNGKRGQKFLRELLEALDAMPDKRLIREQLRIDGDQRPYGDPDLIVGADELVSPQGHAVPVGAVCALGAVGVRRGMDLAKIDPDDTETVAAKFGIADAMTREIVYWNDEGGHYRETPEYRWKRMRAWVESKLHKAVEAA